MSVVYENLEDTAEIDSKISIIVEEHRHKLLNTSAGIQSTFKSTYRKVRRKGKLRKVVITSFVLTGDGTTKDQVLTELTKQRIVND